MSELDIKKRVLSQRKGKENDYDWDMEVVHRRLQANKESLVEVEVYYISKYNNVKTVEAGLSKWGVVQQTKAEI